MQWIEQRRRAWDGKPVVRYIYREEFFSRLRKHMLQGGRHLELGSALGELQADIPGLITSDIVPAPGMTLVCDAHELPFQAVALRNVIGVDVLHHLENIGQFLQECERVLEPGGRLVFIEPWITPFARLVWHFHHEECNLRINPYDQVVRDPSKDPFHGNLALTYLAFQTYRAQFSQSFTSLRILAVLPFSFLVYPLSFGFKQPNVLPLWLAKWLQKLENWTGFLWRRWGALRVVLVIEKRQGLDG